jgi:hypothetical protein
LLLEEIPELLTHCLSKGDIDGDRPGIRSQELEELHRLAFYGVSAPAYFASRRPDGGTHSSSSTNFPPHFQDFAHLSRFQRFPPSQVVHRIGRAIAMLIPRESESRAHDPIRDPTRVRGSLSSPPTLVSSAMRSELGVA